jgi:hypothetical protein
MCPILPHLGIVDTLAFLAILITAKRRGRNRYPGIPSILDNIFRDATISFVIVFIYHLVQQFFLIFADSVGDVRYVWRWLILLCSSCACFQEAVQRAPGM